MSRGYQPGRRKTFKSAGDLSAAAKRYTFVKPSGNQQVNTCGAGEAGIGVQQDTRADGVGKPVNVMLDGTSKIRVDGSGTAIAAGDYLKADANGAGIKAASTNVVNAIALEAATAAGVYIEGELLPMGSKMP